MLAAMVLVAGLFGGPKHVAPSPGAGCPAVPVASFTTTALACPALEISGRDDATAAILDPAFDVTVAPAQLARVGPGDTVLTGYAADGTALFSLPIASPGPFHLYVPLSPAAQALLARITLTGGNASAERSATAAAEPTAEIIALDDRRIVIAWNAAAFPAIRVSDAPASAPIGSGSGSSTFEQIGLDTRAHRLYITFSNGVRSVVRAIAIFGR